MRLDPEAVRSKPGSVFLQWQTFAAADAMVDDWRAAEQEAAIQRQMRG